jgi:V-type H+-transporting ATPase proteolipid subunit
MGCAVAISFTSFGASYGMAKSGIGIMASSILRPDMMIRSGWHKTAQNSLVLCH